MLEIFFKKKKKKNARKEYSREMNVDYFVLSSVSS